MAGVFAIITFGQKLDGKIYCHKIKNKETVKLKKYKNEKNWKMEKMEKMENARKKEQKG